MSGMSWSPENIETLTSMWRDGLALSDIADRFGCSTNAALKKIYRLRAEREQPSLPSFGGQPRWNKWAAPNSSTDGELPKRRPKINWTPEQDEILTSGLTAGLSFSRLSLKIGRSRCAIAGRVMRLKGEGVLPGYPLGEPRVRKSRARPKIPRVEDSATLQRLRCARMALHAVMATKLPPMTERFLEGFNGQHGRLSIVELGLGDCRYPVDQPQGPVRYCGEPVAGQGAVYCPTHHVRCNVGFRFQSEARARAA